MPGMYLPTDTATEIANLQDRVRRLETFRPLDPPAMTLLGAQSYGNQTFAYSAAFFPNTIAYTMAFTVPVSSYPGSNITPAGTSNVLVIAQFDFNSPIVGTATTVSPGVDVRLAGTQVLGFNGTSSANAQPPEVQYNNVSMMIFGNMGGGNYTANINYTMAGGAATNIAFTGASILVFLTGLPSS